MRSETSATNAYACAYVRGKRMCYAFSEEVSAFKRFNVRALGGCNNGRGYVMHEPKASALPNLDRYYIFRVRHINSERYTGNTVHSASIQESKIVHAYL